MNASSNKTLEELKGCFDTFWRSECDSSNKTLEELKVLSREHRDDRKSFVPIRL